MAGIPNQPYQNPYQPPMPTGSQRPNYPQPVVYRPGQPGVMPVGAMPPDAYRPGMPPTGPRPGMPGAPTAQPQDNYEYVSKKDVAFGALGAGAGFFLGPMIGLSGPIGAIILGIAILAISSVGRAISHNKAQKQAQQPPNQMPHPPQYPNPQMQQGQQFQNQYNYQMDPNQMQDPRYRYPQQ